MNNVEKKGNYIYTNRLFTDQLGRGTVSDSEGWCRNFCRMNFDSCLVLRMADLAMMTALVPTVGHWTTTCPWIMTSPATVTSLWMGTCRVPGVVIISDGGQEGEVCLCIKYQCDSVYMFAWKL